jgi:YHS domain-containing protein
MTLVIDPVCGQQLDSADAVAHSQYQGKTYYFDATECQERFEEDPARYANIPTGDQGRVTHATGDRNTSIAGHTPHTVVGGPGYDNERMQDRAPDRSEGPKQTSLGIFPSTEPAPGEEQPRH